MSLQKYYLYATADNYGATLVEDADNEDGTYYRCCDIDPELARLRERVRELQRCLSEMDSGHLARLNKADERERLLLEAVRWCVLRGALWHEGLPVGQVETSDCGLCDAGIWEPPPEFAPLIAEAVEKQQEQSNGT